MTAQIKKIMATKHTKHSTSSIDSKEDWRIVRQSPQTSSGLAAVLDLLLECPVTIGSPKKSAPLQMTLSEFMGWSLENPKWACPKWSQKIFPTTFPSTSDPSAQLTQADMKAVRETDELSTTISHSVALCADRYLDYIGITYNQKEQKYEVKHLDSFNQHLENKVSIATIRRLLQSLALFKQRDKAARILLAIAIHTFDNPRYKKSLDTIKAGYDKALRE